MEKGPGLQAFSSYKELEHVFISNQLKVINKQGIEYVLGFNGIKDNRVLAVTKYTKLSDLEKSVNDSTFYFGSPFDWLDPFELFFFQSQMNITNEEEPVTIHASCFACNDIENEEGFWQIWSIGEEEPIIRVTYNVEKLLESLNRQSNNQYDFYLAGMEYATRENIKKQQSEQQNSYNTIDEYINKLCLKRNAYKYENELRLFVKKSANNNLLNKTIINNIDYNDGIIAEITLPPAKPFGNSHPAKDKMKGYQDCVNSSTKQRLQNLVDNGNLNCIINQSALYCIDYKKRTYKV